MNKSVYIIEDSTCQICQLTQHNQSKHSFIIGHTCKLFQMKDLN